MVEKMFINVGLVVSIEVLVVVCFCGFIYRFLVVVVNCIGLDKYINLIIM